MIREGWVIGRWVVRGGVGWGFWDEVIIEVCLFEEERVVRLSFGEMSILSSRNSSLKVLRLYWVW